MLLGHGALAASFAFFSSLSHAARATTSGTASAAAMKRPRGLADIDVLSVVWSGHRLHTHRRGTRGRHPVNQEMHERMKRNSTRVVSRSRKRLRPEDAQAPFEHQRKCHD